MKAPTKKIIKSPETMFQIIARKHNTSAEYVGKINRGERNPTRGKGLMILNELKQLTQNN